MNDFVKSLIRWYEGSARDLPWRSTTDPYLIWLSEVLLQQTRVDQGLPYYLKFIQAFPTIQHLASASEEEVLKLWQGLGYYSRARNMLQTARYIAYKMNGIFPHNSKTWKQMKGVGDYTAAAISSFAFGEVIPVLDGNVARVTARLLACSEDITKNTTRQLFLQFLEQLIPAAAPAVFNQAMMELGAMVCKPGKPDCASCPVASHCQGRLMGMAASLPVKAKKAKPTLRYFDYFHLVYGNRTWLIRRPSGDIWQGLHEFPMVENTHPEPVPRIPFLQASALQSMALEAEYTHRLTHQLINARFWKIYTTPEQINPLSGIFECAHNRLKEYALHRLMVRYLEQQHIETET